MIARSRVAAQTATSRATIRDTQWPSGYINPAVPRLKELPQLLEHLEVSGRLREPEDGRVREAWRASDSARHVDASSNDYLGLGRRIVSRETSEQGFAVGEGQESPRTFSVSRETVQQTFSGEAELASRAAPLGAGASRLIHGTAPQHLAVERAFARWVGVEAALLFASGYAANVGTLGALLGPEDLVVSDALNHASLIDGIRLSRAKVHLAGHLSLRDVEKGLEAGATWVVVESYYSMDGDGPNLRELRRLCDRFGANLYVDEAHSLGVFGPAGSGLCAAAGIVPDVIVGAFGKAVGSHGAAVGGTEVLRTWLYNRARSFVFSTAPSPIHALDLLEQLERARLGEAERTRLQRLVERFRNQLSDAGLELGRGTFGPIVGVRVGSEERSLALAKALRDRGILAQAIRPPTVPVGDSRVRMTLNASWSLDDVEFVAGELVAAFEALPG